MGKYVSSRRYTRAPYPPLCGPPSSRGKAKRRRLRRKKGSQPRLAALGSPFQRKGLACIHPPSYGRRCPEGAEVGWRKAVFSYQSLPRVGKVASGASQIGLQRYEKSKGSLFSGEEMLQLLRQPKIFRGVVLHLYQQALPRRISPLRLPPAEHADDPPTPLYARRSSGGAPAGSHLPAAPARCSG